MFNFEGILFLILVILLPILLFQALISQNETFTERLSLKSSFLFGLLCSASIMICMTYPLTFTYNYIFDLRTIPWIIAILYGGLPATIFSTVVLFGYRILIGGLGFYGIFFSYSISLVVILVHYKKFQQYSTLKKIMSGAGYILLLKLLLYFSIVFLVDDFNADFFLNFYIYFVIIHLALISFVIYLIETLKDKKRLEDRIHLSEKIHLIGELAASVAHEIRNPLTSVRGFMQLFHAEKNITSDQQHYLRIMISELDKAEHIINEYLSLAKPELETTEIIDLKESSQQVTEVISSYGLINGVQLINQVTDSMYICANRNKINQVLLNIIKNGIEACKDNGTITLKMTKERQKAIIEISDNGVGMSEDELAKVGSLFYSTKQKGTGIGLTFCYRTIEYFGGSITVESEKDVGTTFIIELPLVDKDKQLKKSI
jgi:two-component system, sporulation sensor kinase B